MNTQLDLLQKIYDEFKLSKDGFDYLEYIYKFNPDENWVGTELFIYLYLKMVYQKRSI